MLKLNPKTRLTLIILSIISTNIIAQSPFGWKVIQQLPAYDKNQKQYGLGGAISGIHSNKLLIAGGSNFEGIMPWKGGKKRYFNQIYVLNRIENDKLEWQKEIFNLPFNIAYSATISTPKGIFCLGGENENGVLNHSFILKWDSKNQNIKIENLQDLPEKITNASAVFDGKFVYVLGGENADKTLHTVYRLAISTSKNQWEKLNSIPTPLSHSVALYANHSIYLVGGRAKVPSNISHLSNHTYKLDLKTLQWQKVADISIDSKSINALSAGSGIVLNKNRLLLIGGDKGDIFSKIEDYNLKISQTNSEKLRLEKENLLENHIGFSRDLLIYDIKTDTWTKIGEVPIMVPVTTSSHKWGKDIVIPSGEVKPGIRTNDILFGKSIK